MNLIALLGDLIVFQQMEVAAVGVRLGCLLKYKDLIQLIAKIEEQF